MTQQHDALVQVLKALETTRSEAPAVIRRQAWKAVADAGVDVSELGPVVHGQVQAELQGRVDRSRTRHAEHLAALEAYTSRPKVFPTAPTPERLQHAQHGVKSRMEIAGSGTKIAAVKSHTISGPLDRYSEHFDEWELSVLTSYVRGFEAASRVTGLVSSYGNSPGGGAFGPRDGGVAERERIAYLSWVHASAQLPEEFRSVADALCRDVLTVEAQGRDAFGRIRDKATLRGAGLGILKGLAWLLKHIEIKEQALRRDRAAVNRSRRVAAE